MEERNFFSQAYSTLSDSNALSAIFFSANQTTQISEIIAKAWELLHHPIAVTDALHYVIGVSPDITAQCGSTPDWKQLLEAGLAPAAHEPPEHIHPPKDIPVRDLPLGNNLRFHFASCPERSTYHVMCDIMDKDALLLKLTITSSAPLTEAESRICIVLANALHLAYFRFRCTTNTMLDDRSRFFLTLLQGNASENAAWAHYKATLQGPFQLACADMQQIGFHNLSFLSFLDQTLPSGFLAVQDSTSYLILIPLADKSECLSQLDQYAQSHNMTLAVSECYENLDDTRSNYEIMQPLLRIAKQFSGKNGVVSRDDYLLYLMFDQLAISGQSFINPDALLLAKHDRKAGTDYVHTLFCWLLYDMKSTISASKMYIHRNTMDHRISKIQELIHGRWNDQTYVFQMLYSLYIILQQNDQLIYY